MSQQPRPIVKLSEMVPGQEADVFVLMSDKQELTTRDGKPYFRVSFRDRQREVTFPVWSDSRWGDQCRRSWTPGTFYKIRGVYQETAYGPQLEIRKIREACEADRADGFDPHMLLPHTSRDPEVMFEQLLQIVRERIEDANLRKLVATLLVDHRAAWLQKPAARRHHHAFLGGLLEHTLSVVQVAVFLAEHYAEQYPELEPPLDRDLVVAGAIVHDIGKLRELELQPGGTAYTAEGELLGHMLLGRDMVREAARSVPVDPEKLLRLEHLVIAHQRLPEWGAAKPPMTPEAYLVHYADDVDAKFRMVYDILHNDPGSGPVTSNRNLLGQKLYRGRHSAE